MDKIHRKSLWALGAVFLAGVLLPSFHSGDSGPTVKLWVAGVALYIPFYVAHSNELGEISVQYCTVYKNEQPILFRFSQAMYLVFSVVLLLIMLSRI